MNNFLDPLTQQGFAGWGSVLLSYVHWRDVMMGIAATNNTFRAHLKAHYKLAGIAKMWHRAKTCGWCHVTHVEVNLSARLAPFLPASSVEDLTCQGDIQVWRNDGTAATTRLVCPELRTLRLHTRAEERSSCAGEIAHRMLSAKLLDMLRNERLRSELEVWQEVWVAQTAWRFDAPKLQRLHLDTASDSHSVSRDDFMYATSVLMSVGFGRENCPPLLHLDLGMRLPNNDLSVHVMARLALSLRSLTAAVMLPTPEQPSTWLWEVEAWPELRELSVTWDGFGASNEQQHTMLREFHAPHLHTLRVEDRIGNTDLGNMSVATLRALRSLEIEINCRCSSVTTPTIDLGHFPDTLAGLKLHTRHPNTCVLKALPVGLRALALDDFFLVTIAAGEGNKVRLPQLRRLAAPPAALALFDAPQLREVVWCCWSGLVNVTPTMAGVLDKVRHVTFLVLENAHIPDCFQPWVTRIELGGKEPAMSHAATWSSCLRLRALHMPRTWSAADESAVREWAKQHKHEFWMRECSVDDD